jgi:RNA polymerase sigma factor (sigma-70 family)
MKKLLQSLKSDESLLLAYQKGDSIAFEVLYMRHKNSLFNFLYNSCRQHQLVEDLAHDIWLSIIRGIENYKAVATFKTYLYRIARNRLIDHWRKEKDSKFEYAEFNEEKHLSTTVSGDSAERTIQVMEILDAIMKLPDEQREAFLLREEGFSQQEIAEITDSKPETVKSRVRYATQQLRAMSEVSL